MFDAVLFDCDGCLVDSEALVAAVVLEQLAAIGLVYELEDYFARFTGMSAATFYAQLQTESLARRGRGLPDGFAQTCQNSVRAAVGTRVAAIAGASNAVRAVRGLKAVASSSTAVALHGKLKRTGLWAPFDPHVYSADDVARAKPAPDLFLYAARGLRVEPARCLVIEDSNHGIAAARAAGMTVWGFTGGSHATPATAHRLRDAGAERVLANWAEAEALFAAW